MTKTLNKYLDTEQQNALLNQIAAIEGAFGTPIPEVQEVIQFGLTNNVETLRTFYNEKGLINTVNDPVAFNEINRLKNAYAKAAGPTWVPNAVLMEASLATEMPANSQATVFVPVAEIVQNG